MLLSKKRTQFVKKITDVASTISERLFNQKYKEQVFFSGRDEDFVTLEFKDDKVLIEIAIQINNLYVIEGHEKVTYRVFTIDKNQSHLFTEVRWTLIDASNGDEVRKILHQLIMLN